MATLYLAQQTKLFFGTWPAPYLILEIYSNDYHVIFILWRRLSNAHGYLLPGISSLIDSILDVWREI